MQFYTIALFIKAKNLKKSGCVSADECFGKLGYIYYISLQPVQWNVQWFAQWGWCLDHWRLQVYPTWEMVSNSFFGIMKASALGQQKTSFFPVGLECIALPVHNMDAFTNLEALQNPYFETLVWCIINSISIPSPFSGEWRGEAENLKLLIIALAFCLSDTQKNPPRTTYFEPKMPHLLRKSPEL